MDNLDTSVNFDKNKWDSHDFSVYVIDFERMTPTIPVHIKFRRTNMCMKYFFRKSN